MTAPRPLAGLLLLMLAVVAGGWRGDAADPPGRDSGREPAPSEPGLLMDASPQPMPGWFIEIGEELGVRDAVTDRAVDGAFVDASSTSSIAGEASAGLGAQVDWVDVTWPDGVRKRFAGDADQALELVRGTGTPVFGDARAPASVSEPEVAPEEDAP